MRGLFLSFAVFMASLALPVCVQAQPATKTAVTAQGLVGELYRPAGRAGRRAALIVLGGSDGGLPSDAEVFAREGYVVLGLAYFGAPGVPAELSDIPLEYFDRAVGWLKVQPGVDPRRIGLVGTSKGAEAGLLAAARNPEIRVVVAGAPSSVAWQGIGAASRGAGASSWSLEGKSTAFLPYDRSVPFTSVGDLYTRSWARRAEHPQAAIPVEKINGPILLICGEADGLWPSCPMAAAVSERLNASRFKPKVTLLRYPGAGHGAVGQPYTPEDPAAVDPLGGTQGGNVAARVDGWPKTLAFLARTLQPRRVGR